MSKTLRSRDSRGYFKSNCFIIFEHKSINNYLNEKGNEVLAEEDAYKEHAEKELAEKEPSMDKPTMDEPIEDEPTEGKQGLVTKDPLNEIKTTTTELKWPDKISEAQKAPILKVVDGLDLDKIQSFLDAIAITKKHVNNPIAYVVGLRDDDKIGKFISPPSSTEIEIEKDENKKRTEEHLELLRQQSIENGEKFIKKHLRNN